MAEARASSEQGDESPRQIPKAKWRPGCLTYSLAVAFLLLVGGWAGQWFWTRSERQKLDAELTAIEQRGEAVWFADLEPEPLPQGQDGTQAYLAAIRAHEEIRKQNAAVWGAFENVEAQPTGPGNAGLLSKYSAGDIAALRAVLAAERPALDLLEKAQQRGTVRTPIDYSTPAPYGIALDSAMAMREFGRLRYAEGLVNLADGDIDQTLASIERSLQLGDLTREEVFLITQLIRVAVSTYGIELTIGLLESQNLTAEQRERLDQLLARLEAEFRMKPTMIAERASMLTMMTYSMNELDDLGAMSDGQAIQTAVYGFLPALQHRDLTMSVKLLNRIIAAVDETGPAATREMQDIENTASGLSDTYLFTKMLLPSTGAVRKAAMRHRQELRCLRIALRVDAFYRNNGRLPNSLSEVVDETLPEIPVGTLSGKPPVLRATRDGFMLYDVGTNGVDDGGGGDQDESDSLIQLIYPAAGPSDASADSSGQFE